jgi:hypothetical protein
MRPRILILVIAASLTLGASVTPTHAFDLTGNWIGKWSCKGFDGSKFTSSSNLKPSTLAITQTGNTFGAVIDAADPNGDYTYNGFAILDGKSADKGEVTLLGCHLGTTLAGPPFDGELVRATVKTKTNTFKASFKGTSIFSDDSPEVGTCKYSYKRTDTPPPAPAIPGCS